MNILPLQQAGLGIPTLILTLIFILGLLTQRKRYQALAEHRTLVQEKEAALGFVQNVGSVFADAETVEMNHLLPNVFFTMPFEPVKRDLEPSIFATIRKKPFSTSPLWRHAPSV